MLSSHFLRGLIRRLAVASVAVVAGVAGDPGVTTAFAQGESLRPITTFGVNGWVAPGTITYTSTIPAQTLSGTVVTGTTFVTGTINVLDISNNARGMGFNRVTGNLVVPSRASSIYTSTTNTINSATSATNTVAIIDGNTGAFVKTMDVSSIASSGQTFTLNMADVSDDGRIFVTNLASGSAQTFRIYEYPTESTTSAPSLAFQALNPGNGGGNATYRFGDSFAVNGVGANTIFAAAGSSSGTTSPGPNSQIVSNFMIGTLDTTSSNSIYRRVAGSNTSANDYRLGLTFVDSDTVIGLQGGPARQTDFVPTGTTGPTAPGVGATITASITSGTATSFGSNVNLRVLDFASIGGKPYLASVVADFSGAANNRVEVYDISSGTNAVLVAALNNTTAVNANGNATGAIQWGAVTQPNPAAPWYYEARLYTLNTNNGIQGMVFSVPEPSTWAMLVTGASLCGLTGYRRRSRRAARSAEANAELAS